MIRLARRAPEPHAPPALGASVERGWWTVAVAAVWPGAGPHSHQGTRPASPSGTAAPRGATMPHFSCSGAATLIIPPPVRSTVAGGQVSGIRRRSVEPLPNEAARSSHMPGTGFTRTYTTHAARLDEAPNSSISVAQSPVVRLDAERPGPVPAQVIAVRRRSRTTRYKHHRRAGPTSPPRRSSVRKTGVVSPAIDQRAADADRGSARLGAPHGDRATLIRLDRARDRCHCQQLGSCCVSLLAGLSSGDFELPRRRRPAAYRRCLVRRHVIMSSAGMIAFVRDEAAQHGVHDLAYQAPGAKTSAPTATMTQKLCSSQF